MTEKDLLFFCEKKEVNENSCGGDENYVIWSKHDKNMYGCRDSVTKRPHKFVQQFSFRHSIQFHLTIFSVLVVITYFFFVSLSDFFPPPLIFTLFFFLFSILSVSKNHQNTSTYMLFSLLIFRSWYKFYSRQSENCSTNAGRLACTESLFVHLQYCFCWCFFLKI